MGPEETAYTQYPKLFGADLKTLSHPNGVLPRVVCSNLLVRGRQKSRAKIKKKTAGDLLTANAREKNKGKMSLGQPVL